MQTLQLISNAYNNLLAADNKWYSDWKVIQDDEKICSPKNTRKGTPTYDNDSVVPQLFSRHTSTALLSLTVVPYAMSETSGRQSSATEQCSWSSRRMKPLRSKRLKKTQNKIYLANHNKIFLQITYNNYLTFATTTTNDMSC